MARPSEMTEDVVKKLEDSLKNGFTITKSCQLSGISRETYYNWLEADPIFLDRMTFAQAFALEAARQNVVNAIVNDKDMKTSRWYLERKASNEFGLKTKVDTTITDNREVLSEEDALRLKQELMDLTGGQADVNGETDTPRPESS